MHNGGGREETERVRVDPTWRAQMSDDWIAGHSDKSMPILASSRALHKSPIYVSIESTRQIIEREGGGAGERSSRKKGD